MIMPNENFLKAISWTLVHSLWQGIILAVFAGLVISFTKKSTSVLRYNLLASLFVSFMIGVGFTFNYEFQEENRETITRLNLPINSHNSDLMLEVAPKSEEDFSLQIIDFLNANSNLIVMIWFLIFSIKCFGIFRSLSNIYRIRNYRNQEVPEYWTQRVLELSQILKIKKRIVLLESQLVSVPSVTGFFKPIILIPIGLLSHLPQDQIEAILLHELAHIRRKDYFINLIQSFAEILFFFNPGVLWVSSIIKEERENCCDDIAVGITQNKSKFIHALVSFQEYNMKQNNLALGFGSRKNQLLERAKRIIHDNNKSLNSIEKTFLAICIVIIASFTVACSNTKATASQPNHDVAFATEIEEENLTDDGLSDEERAKMEAEIAEAEALAEIESEAEVAKAEAEAAQLEAEAAEREAEIAQAEAEKALAEANLSGDELTQIKNDAEQAKKDREIARNDALIAREESRKISEKARAESQKARLSGQQARLEAQKASLEAQKERVNASLKKLESQIEKEKYKKGLGSSVITKESTTDVNGVKTSNKMSIYADAIPPISMDDISKDIIGDLISEKVITSAQNLSYKLSNYELIVNDKNISENVRQKFQKYLKPNISAVYYNFDVDADDAKLKNR